MFKFSSFILISGFILTSIIVAGQTHLDIINANSNIEYRLVVGKVDSALKSQSDYSAKKDYKHFKRWQLATESHIGPNGVLTNYVAKNLLAYRKIKSTQTDLDSRNPHGHWTDVTPPQSSLSIPNNGRVNVIAVHPSNSLIVYIGTAVGGLWKSLNGGITWQSLTDGLPVIGISGLCIDPTNPDNIYMLTGDGDGRHVPSIGILKSTNGGSSWSPTNFAPGVDSLLYGYKLVMDPNDPDVMIVVTTRGIFRTSNGWDSFQPTNVISSMRDIEFQPGNSDTVYASSQTRVYRSTNGGAQWGFLGQNGTGLPNATAMTRVAVGVTPDNPSRIYALFGFDGAPGGNGYQGLYTSTDSGDSWVENTDTVNIVGDGVTNQTGWDLSLGIDPSDESNVIVGGIFMWQSLNSGQSGSWTKFESGYHTDIHDIVYADNIIYVACDGGMVKSLDGGQTWINISDGLNLLQMYDFDVEDNRLICGTQDLGTILWQLGDSVAQRVIGADGFECFFHPTDTNIVYGCTQGSRAKSTAGGSSGSFNPIHPPGHGGSWGASWLMHPNNPDTLYAAFDNIARTYDGGAIWDTMANPEFNDSYTGNIFYTVVAMAQGINNPDYFYVSDRRQIAKTSNIHAAIPTWTNVTANLPFSVDSLLPEDALLGGITVDPNDPQTVWITVLGYSEGNKVFLSPYGGSIWINISGNLPNVPIYAIVYQPGSSDGLYVATDIGVFYKNSGLSEWIYWSNGLPTTRVEDLKISDGFLYAGTFGRGIWRSALFTNCPTDYSLSPSNDPSSPNSTGKQVYHASSTIISSRIITGGIGTDVTYNAGTFIRMTPGFWAKRENFIEAIIAGCPD